MNDASPSNLIDGKALAKGFRARTKNEVERLQRETGITPGLAVIRAGDDPASAAYVRSKEKAAKAAGMRAEVSILPEETAEAQLLAQIEAYNANDAIDGILVQLPLPDHIDQGKALNAVRPDKDVDGFHPVSLGRLVEGETPTPPCTPKGILEALRALDVPMAGANAVVVGRSVIVGKPMALLLTHQHATVTICHSRTTDLAAVTRQADILVAAVGRPFMLGADHVKEGAVVIDVGINRVEADFMTPEAIASNPAHEKSLAKKSYALVGDVAFHEVQKKARLITPVPGGVGPLTVAMLLSNTVELAKLRRAG